MVSAEGLCLAFAAGWEHTRSLQLSQCSAVITHHLPATSQPHEGKHYPLCRQEKWKLKNKLTTKKKTNPRGEVWSHTAPSHSLLDGKEGMLEGHGMTAAPGTAWQEANGLGHSKSTWDEEELSKCQQARKMLWP